MLDGKVRAAMPCPWHMPERVWPACRRSHKQATKGARWLMGIHHESTLHFIYPWYCEVCAFQGASFLFEKIVGKQNRK